MKESSSEVFLEKNYSEGKNWFLPNKYKQMEEKLCIKPSLCCPSSAHLLHVETLPEGQPQTQGMGTALCTYSLAQTAAGAPHVPCCTTEHSWAQCHWYKQEITVKGREAPSAPTVLFQRDSAHPFWVPSPHRAQPETCCVPLYPKTWTAVHHKSCNSCTVDAWGPKHCLIYFCVAQNLDVERGLWNVSKMIIVFFAKTAKSSLASKKHLGDRNK